MLYRLLIAFVLASMVACTTTSYQPFTQNLYDENRWTERDLRQIQFYLSQDITLFRELSNNQSEIIQGEIKIMNGRRVEQIRFPSGTPGVFLFSPKANRLAVSFEEGGEGKYLMFGPNPKLDNRYVLLASDWERNQGIVTYDGQKFTISADEAYASLLVDLKRAEATDINQRVAKGRTLPARTPSRN